ncbi:MAG: UDP-N-acetylmuramoyl-L-alanyl-D-glutamate--2,6-diaminopimelate ligase [Desulfohalobiaceae bacterium]|nr:UDP-N-acetylmuramoyl-L-alanyl-D-glutamate--2,6-diaminopimelate ligase [Desulfohalobiaceae bacterium]
MNEITLTTLLDRVRSGLKVHSHSSGVRPGDVFVALTGGALEGSRYIPLALSQGAGYVVSNCRFDPGQAGTETCFVYSPDPNQALGQLAAASCGTEVMASTLVGITGTNGKTTIAHGLDHLLQGAGKSCGLLGTIAYRWPGHEQEAALTTPGCLELHRLLAEMQSLGVETVCMEVSSHALVQQRVAGLCFDLALFSNLSHDHLDYHSDMEDYFQAKSRLFALHKGKRPFPILNLDDPYGQRLAAAARPGLGFGLKPAAVKDYDFLQGRLIRLSREGIDLEMTYRGQKWRISSPLLGRHNASNLLAVQATGLKLGLSPDELASLSGFPGVPGRLERVRTPFGAHVFIDYAHTPEGLRSVLKAIREIDFERVIVVFGCGGDRDRAKRPLMGRAVAENSDLAVLTSDNPRSEDPLSIMQEVLPGLEGKSRVIQEPDRAWAIELALHEAGPGDAVIIAGKGHETYQDINGEKKPFSDREKVLALCA